MAKIANQDTERITRTAEAALVKKALAGDTTALTQLLKRSHASSSQSTCRRCSRARSS